MRFEFFLSRKLSQKKEGFVSLITKLAFVGIFLGVASLITVMSVMNGFKEELMRQLIGMKGHGIIYQASGIHNYPNVIATLPKEITLALPVIEEPTLMIHHGQYHGVMLYGHDPQRLIQHQYFREGMKSGNIKSLNQKDTILIGTRLAEEFNLKVGDRVKLLNPEGEETFFGMIPKERTFIIGGIFELGMREYDRRFVMTSIPTIQSFFTQEKNIHHIDIFTKTGRVDTLKVPFPLHVMALKHTDTTLFKALLVQKRVMFIILSLMLLIAVLNIVSSMTMLVKDKTKEIAILRSMGMKKNTVVIIFLMSGCMIGVAGTLSGILFGVLLSQNVNTMTQLIERAFHVQIFNPELYFFSHVPTMIAYQDILLVSGISLTFSLLATLYPAIRASRLDPAPVLR